MTTTPIQTEVEADPSPELSEAAGEILHAAVRVARNEQIKTLSALKRAMMEIFPNQEVDIDQALKFWGTNVQKRGDPRLRM